MVGTMQSLHGSQILTLYAQRPIVEKHAKYAFYHPFSEAIASMITDLPNKIVTSVVFNITVYFMTNLRRTPSAFFTFYLFSFMCVLAMSMFFRSIGAFSRTLAQASKSSRSTFASSEVPSESKDVQEKSCGEGSPAS